MPFEIIDRGSDFSQRPVENPLNREIGDLLTSGEAGNFSQQNSNTDTGSDNPVDGNNQPVLPFFEIEGLGGSDSNTGNDSSGNDSVGNDSGGDVGSSASEGSRSSERNMPKSEPKDVTQQPTSSSPSNEQEAVSDTPTNQSTGNDSDIADPRSDQPSVGSPDNPFVIQNGKQQ